LKQLLIANDQNLSGLDLQFYQQAQNKKEDTKVNMAMGALMTGLNK